MTHKVSELKKMIMEYKKKDTNCPTVTGKKKAELVEIATKLGLISKAHAEPMKEVKEEMKVVLKESSKKPSKVSGIGSFMVKPPKEVAPAPVAVAEGKKKRAPSAYNKFIAEQTKGGKMSMKEAAAMFKAQKGKPEAPKVEAPKVEAPKVEEKPKKVEKPSKAEKKKPEVVEKKVEAKGEPEAKFPKKKSFDTKDARNFMYEHMGNRDVDSGDQIKIYQAIHGIPPLGGYEKGVDIEDKHKNAYEAGKETVEANLATFDELDAYELRDTYKAIDDILVVDEDYKIPKVLMKGYMEYVEKKKNRLPIRHMTKDELISAVINSGCKRLRGLHLAKMTKDEIMDYLVKTRCPELLTIV
jgi:hypothetical protein